MFAKINWIDILKDMFRPETSGMISSFRLHRMTIRNLGAIEEPGFARAFIDMWIGEDSQFPKLSLKLRGGDKDGSAAESK